MASSQSRMSELHEMLAEILLEDLKQSKADGIPLPAANLGVIRQFLKDNDITASMDAKDMQKLRAEFTDDLAAKREQRKSVQDALAKDDIDYIMQ